MSSEFERIGALHQLFGPPPQEVSTGIGDDAAVLSLRALAQGAEHLVWTVDSCVERVHFRRDIASWQDVGWRSFMAAASDLAAMGARPVGALSALMLSSDITDEQLFELGQGQRDAASLISCAIIGGNLSRGGEVSVTTTVLGASERVVGRDGAQEGDVLIVCGEVGLAAAGLGLLLRDGASWDRSDPEKVAAVRAWARPVARISDGLRCAQVASAMIDISDGLAQDSGHIAHASKLGIELDPELLVDQRLLRLAKDLDVSALELVLSGGEDYVVLATCKPDKVPAGFRVIGRCQKGHGVWLQGQSQRLDSHGHDHFRSTAPSQH